MKKFDEEYYNKWDRNYTNWDRDDAYYLNEHEKSDEEEDDEYED